MSFLSSTFGIATTPSGSTLTKTHNLLCMKKRKKDEEKPPS
jgi:hypothetical protein